MKIKKKLDHFCFYFYFFARPCIFSSFIFIFIYPPRLNFFWKFPVKHLIKKNWPYGDLVYKLRRVKNTPNFISSGSKIVKRLRWRQYDPVIIERTIGLVLGPFTALYRPFIRHCTLTKKAVGTIWRALSKPPQRRQGPDLCPLWLLVGTPSAIRPEIASSRVEHSRPYSDVAKYIFDI